jgi:DNA-binding NarL/FixJ family response regulator
VIEQAYPGNVLIVEQASALCDQWRNALVSLGLCVQCAQSLETAQDLVAEAHGWIDYLIVDPDLPDGNRTPQFVKQILCGKYPTIVAVILHQLEDASFLEMAYHGAQLVPKPLGSSSIRLLVRLLERHRHAKGGVIGFAREHHLSPCETQVLEAQLNGVSNKMIARSLNSTEHAINQTIRRIHKKLGASTFREIVSQWRRHMADANPSGEEVWR